MNEQKIIPTSFGWEWLPKTWALYQRNPGKLIGTFVSFIIVSMIASVLPIIGPFVSGLLYPILMFGALKIAEDCDQNKTPRVSDLFYAFSDKASFRSLLSLCITSALMMAASGVITAVLFGMGMKFQNDPMAVLPSALAGGFVILIIYMVVSMFWFFGPGFVYFAKLSGKKAMEASITAAFRNWKPFIVMALVWVGIAFALMLPMGCAALAQRLMGGNSAPLFLLGAAEAIVVCFVLGPMHFCMPYFMFKEIYPKSNSLDILENFVKPRL